MTTRLHPWRKPPPPQAEEWTSTASPARRPFSVRVVRESRAFPPNTTSTERLPQADPWENAVHQVQRFNRSRLLDAPLARTPNVASGLAVVPLFNPSHLSRRTGKVRTPTNSQTRTKPHVRPLGYPLIIDLAGPCGLRRPPFSPAESSTRPWTEGTVGESAFTRGA